MSLSLLFDGYLDISLSGAFAALTSVAVLLLLAGAPPTQNTSMNK